MNLSLNQQEVDAEFDKGFIRCLEGGLPFVSLLYNGRSFPAESDVVPGAGETGAVPVGVVARHGDTLRFVPMLGNFGRHQILTDKTDVQRNERNPPALVPLIDKQQVREFLFNIGVGGVVATTLERFGNCSLTCTMALHSTVTVRSNNFTINNDFWELLNQPGVIETVINACHANLLDKDDVCLAFPIQMQIGSLDAVAQNSRTTGGRLGLPASNDLQARLGATNAWHRSFGAADPRSFLSSTEMVLFRLYTRRENRRKPVIVGPWTCRGMHESNFTLATQQCIAFTDGLIDYNLSETRGYLMRRLQSDHGIQPSYIEWFMFSILSKLINLFRPVSLQDHLQLLEYISEAGSGYRVTQPMIFALTERYRVWLDMNQQVTTATDQLCHYHLQVLLFRALPLYKWITLPEVLISANIISAIALLFLLLFYNSVCAVGQVWTCESEQSVTCSSYL